MAETTAAAAPAATLPGAGALLAAPILPTLLRLTVLLNAFDAIRMRAEKIRALLIRLQ